MSGSNGMSDAKHAASDKESGKADGTKKKKKVVGKAGSVAKKTADKGANKDSKAGKPAKTDKAVGDQGEKKKAKKQRKPPKPSRDIATKLANSAILRISSKQHIPRVNRAAKRRTQNEAVLFLERFLPLCDARTQQSFRTKTTAADVIANLTKPPFAMLEQSMLQDNPHYVKPTAVLANSGKATGGQKKKVGNKKAPQVRRKRAPKANVESSATEDDVAASSDNESADDGTNQNGDAVDQDEQGEASSA